MGIRELEQELKDLRTMCDALRTQIEERAFGLAEQMARVADAVQINMVKVAEFEERFEGHCTGEFAEVQSTVADMLVKVDARNKSAPTKRNMTDGDARSVLTGDQKDAKHEDAASALGLTYSQVYSCRKEFTFKHVHKELRDAHWRNPWSS